MTSQQQIKLKIVFLLASNSLPARPWRQPLRLATNSNNRWQKMPMSLALIVRDWFRHLGIKIFQNLITLILYFSLKDKLNKSAWGSKYHLIARLNRPCIQRYIRHMTMVAIVWNFVKSNVTHLSKVGSICKFCDITELIQCFHICQKRALIVQQQWV